MHCFMSAAELAVPSTRVRGLNHNLKSASDFELGWRTVRTAVITLAGLFVKQCTVSIYHNN